MTKISVKCIIQMFLTIDQIHKKTCTFGFYNIEAFNFTYYKVTGSPSVMHMTCFDTSNTVLQGREIWTILFLSGSFIATICLSN